MKVMQHKFDEGIYNQLVKLLREGYTCNLVVIVEDIEVVGTPTHKLVKKLKGDNVYASPYLVINKSGIHHSVCFDPLCLEEAVI